MADSIVSADIILPVYNRQDTVRRAIESVLQQSWPDWNLYLVDDASSDQTLSVVRSYSDPRIHVIARGENGGAAAARNLGIRNGSGAIVCFLDSDDVYHPEFLQRVLSKWSESADSVGLMWTGVRFVRMTGGHLMHEDHLWTPVVRETPYLTFLHDLRIGTNAGISIRRNALDKVGLFNEELPAAEDTDIFLRLTKQFGFTWVSDCLIEIDQTGTDRLSRRFDKIARAYNIMIPLHTEAIEQSPVLQRKFYYKLMWLNYHLGDFPKARKYFESLRGQRLAGIREWLVVAIFEIFRQKMGSTIHKAYSAWKKGLD